MTAFSVLLFLVLLLESTILGFSPSSIIGNNNNRLLNNIGSSSGSCIIGRSEYSSVVLSAAGSNKKKRRRRRRKEQATTAPPAVPGAETTTTTANEEIVIPKSDLPTPVEIDEEIIEDEEVNPNDILDVAKFKFEGEIATPESQPGVPEEIPQQPDSQAIPLPDIKEALKKKQMEEELARAQEEEEEQRVLIKRSDKEAFAKLLEQQPYADADDSYFEKEEYGTVSALLAEGAKPFLGIPSGPLQVGHFIGALVIVLMAFVEYPGFPLTNLPTPLRGALQGGLATVYAINIVLAVLAVFKAGERGQPALLWVAKTFSVGGLAYDQLTQLPTLEEIEKAKARKGKRALKNRKK